jgi:hypothetical protein
MLISEINKLFLLLRKQLTLKNMIVKIAENNNLSIRYTSLFELQKISIDSRKSLDEIREDALIEKKGNR